MDGGLHHFEPGRASGRPGGTAPAWLIEALERPDAQDLLCAYLRIGDPRLARAAVEVVRRLAAE